MNIADMLGRSSTDNDADLPEDMEVPDYPPADDADIPSGNVDSDILSPDPAPKRDGRKARRGSAVPAKKATAAQRKAIEDACSMMLLTLGGGISFRDAHCGGLVTEHADNVAAKMVPIIARNPQWVEWFTGTSGWLDVMGLLIALRPIGAGFWAHHVSHTVGEGVAQVDYSQFTAPDL